MMNAYAVSWWRMAVVALWMVALPSGAEEVSSADVACAAARWAEGHPLFGPEVTVKSVDAMGEAPSMVYAVRFSSGAAAVFAGDTTQPPCRWFSTASAEEALETAARALAAAPVSGGTFSAEWDTLLAEDVPSERAARSLPEGTPLPGNAVGPLIRRNWSQEGHYNRMCPLRTSATYNHANDDRMYSGCVATAFAMYLDYYRWPFRGVGSTADSIESAWGASPDITACRTDFAVDFDFDALLDRYLLTASQRETMAVAQLMADSGAILEMDYGDDSSSSSFDNYAAVLSTHLLYNEWVSLANINTHPEKVPQVKAALAAGQPLLCNGIAGYDGNGEPMGHAYLCDGFCEVVIGDTTNTYYHFNFGWNGSGNDWCTADAVITHALADGESGAYPLGNLLLNATPLGTPLFHRTPSVVGPSPALSWEVADFWTNRLEGFTLARQTKQPVQQNETLAPESWYVRSAGWGWAVIDGKTVATVEDFLYSCSYPTMGVNAWLTNGLAISAETTLTIEYSIKRFDSGVSLYLTPSDADGNPMAFDADGITPSLKIATLTGGNSTAEWTTGTLTLTGTGALTPLVGQTGVQLIFYFADSTGAGSSLYGGGTEVFRIDSTALSGTAEDWVTAETVSVSAAQRAHTFSHLTEETHRLILTAEYAGETNFSSTLLLPVSVSNEPPGIVCVETSNALVYTISGADDFTYAFRTQNNSLDGTATRSGNTVTYAFPAAITNYGTHWITLAVTNSATGFGTRDYHVLNLPVESSLRPHTEFTLSNAVERAAAEGKNVLLFSLAKPDAPSLYGIRDVLANAAVLNALTNYFILWEHGALHAEEQSLTESYWKPQPGQSFGFTGETNCYPSAYGYLFLIAPSSATNQIPGDELPTYYSGTTRWDYDNAQYSLTSPAAVDASNFVRFLSQSFALPVSAFSICDAESGAALTNVAVASAVLDAVRQAAGDSLGDIRQIAIPTAQADALYLFGLAASVHVINQAASASVNYQFSVTNVSLREDNGQIWVQLTAAVHDDEAGGGLAPSVLGRAYLLGKPSMNPDSGDWQPVAETGTSFMDGVVRIPEFDLSSNRFFFIEIRP